MSYYAIVDADGNLVSEGSVIDADAIKERGLTAVEVDGPNDGRPWDARKKEWGTRPTPVKPRMERARELWPEDDSAVPAFARSLAVALGIKD